MNESNNVIDLSDFFEDIDNMSHEEITEFIEWFYEEYDFYIVRS